MGGSKSKPTEEALALIQDLTTQHKVTVFSKTYCGFCRLAKQTLDSTGVTYHVMELDVDPSGDAVQVALHHKTGQRTVPNVFIGKQSVGGGEEVASLHRSGKLTEMLKEIGAL